MPMSKKSSLMYYLAGRYPSLLNCGIHKFFCLPQLMSTYVQISSGSTDSNKKQKQIKTVKLVGRAGTASRLDSNLLERDEIRGES